MIHTSRTVTVGKMESVINEPIMLYRGDREVEIEFDIVGSKFMFSNGGNVIKSTNATNGQLVINTPTGENMFSEVTECNDGKVVCVITKEMIDELAEVGFYSFQIRLFDESQVSRVTIPPVYQGIEIRNPIAAEDETDLVDIGLVDFSVVRKDNYENVVTFLPNGEYNKTLWEEHDVISKDRLNKVEDALYEINKGTEGLYPTFQNQYDEFSAKVDKDVKAYKEEVEDEVEQFERDMTQAFGEFKVDYRDDMYDRMDVVEGELESVNSQLEHVENKIEKQFINVDDFGAKGDGVTDDTEAIQAAIDYASEFNLGTVIFSNKTYAIRGIDKDNTTGLEKDTDRTKIGIQCKSGVNLVGISMNDTKIKILPNSHERYAAFFMRGCKNIKISDMFIQGDTLEHTGTTGEWGHGIICTMSQNIIFENLKITDMWGDGIYLGLSSNHENLDFEDIPKNIIIRNVEIDNVGRNGLALCTVDTLYIDNLKCTNITRTFPKAGIDIEAEGWDGNHQASLKNIRINNYYAAECLKGIDIFTTKTDIEYDIEINNYTSINNTQAILCEDRNQNTGHIKINNFYAKNTKYNSILCCNKSNTYRLTIDGVNILNNGAITGANNLTGILQRGAIVFICDRDMIRDNGNVHLNNVRIYNDNDILCRYPVAMRCADTSGKLFNQNGFKFKDIKITNINEFASFNSGAGGHNYVYTTGAEIENVEIDSRKFIYTGTYPNPRVASSIRNIVTLSDDHIGSTRMICYLNDTDTIYDGAEITLKKSNHLTIEYVISLHELNTPLHGIDNPNDLKVVYTSETGAELTVRLIDGEWYIVRKVGTWMVRGGL